VDEMTTELVRALHAVNRHMREVATGLLSGSLPAAKQHEFARLLIDLGTLLHQHAAANGEPPATEAMPDPPP
jgi:hypothetical protein